MDIITGIVFSFNQATWITWMAIAVLAYQTIRGFRIAYEENDTYKDMKQNVNKRGIAHFYTAIITSLLCLLIFFLPYIMYLNDN
jgi:hypothetical protein